MKSQEVSVFEDILQRLVTTVPGATGAIFADWEGESVAHYCLYDEYDLKVIAAHQGIIMSHLRDIHDQLAPGEMNEAVISTETEYLVTGAITREYTLVMTMERRGVLGRGLYHFRKAVDALRREIE
jgi:predicted regulator of Ras-like GTPase activity (Roadblock/LC7/MglB family)